MMRIKKLSDRGFPTNNRTFVIAEIGINHGGDVDTAKRLIDSAAKAGVDAVKFQTYLTERRAPKGNQLVFDILKKCELPFKAFDLLKQHAQSQGLCFFSTPFDRESVEYLRSIDVNLYKVASFDVVNHELLRQVAASRRPVIMSVGMANSEEIENAIGVLTQDGSSLALLHCISSYPLEEYDANLSVIYKLQDTYDCVIGYSDHTPGIDVPLWAVAAGAQIIEKHFKIDSSMECVDAPVSITEEQTRDMVASIRRIELSFGSAELGVREVERPITIYRRPTQ